MDPENFQAYDRSRRERDRTATINQLRAEGWVVCPPHEVETESLAGQIREANMVQTALELAERLITMRKANSGRKITLREVAAFIGGQ